MPDKQIVDYALAENMDLIFMTSHGKSSVMLWPIGSTADKVLRQTRLPLVIVKSLREPSVQIAPTSLFNRILVPLDGSELGAKVLPFVIGIAGKIACEVVLIHIVDTARSVHSLGETDTVPFVEDELENIKKTSRRLFKGTENIVSSKATGPKFPQ